MHRKLPEDRAEAHQGSIPKTAARHKEDARKPGGFALAPGESIHTESSQKYTVEGFRALATACGFLPRATWCDEAGLFSLHWLESE